MTHTVCESPVSHLDALQKQKVSKLMAAGFDEHQSTAALRCCGNSVYRALRYLQTPKKPKSIHENSMHLGQSECVALDSIAGEFPHPKSLILQVYWACDKDPEKTRSLLEQMYA